MPPKSSTRILKELQKFHSSPTIKLIQPTDNLEILYLDLKINGNDIYPETDTYRLRFIIDSEYPFKAPQVQFIDHDPFTDTKYKIPMHPHIYSNGHICLNILYDGWTPANTVHSVGLSIQSMINGNTENKRPEGDSQYVSRAPINPLHSKWIFDDDTV